MRRFEDQPYYVGTFILEELEKIPLNSSFSPFPNVPLTVLDDNMTKAKKVVQQMVEETSDDEPCRTLVSQKTMDDIINKIKHEHLVDSNTEKTLKISLFGGSQTDLVLFGFVS